MSSFNTNLFKSIDFQESVIDMNFDLGARCHVLIGEMEDLGAREVAVDCLDCLKQTQARETDKLADLTEVLVETQAGIHQKEGHVAKIDLND
ncbi:hypothetical protein Tco_0769044 [Tanacetum coccineum]|uniref:Uncharacterized protein n=1 Tax=Tanacetum coccineum TaxID=301880 RepID=A0ABQ4ZC33_9ASTR